MALQATILKLYFETPLNSFSQLADVSSPAVHGGRLRDVFAPTILQAMTAQGCKNMTTLVVGATGTGRLLVEQLLTAEERPCHRPFPDSLPRSRNHPNLSVIQAGLLELSDAGWSTRIGRLCDAVASCLEPQPDALKGIFGPPSAGRRHRRLCPDHSSQSAEQRQNLC